MKRDIEIRTEDGIAKAGLFQADGGGAAKAGVILYMDAFGPRPALDRMAERLADNGYAVLVPDLFHRKAPYGPFDARTAFADDKIRAELMALVGGTTQEMTRRDTGAFLDALAANGIAGPIGTVGYCMGGGRALNAAAGYPDRIVAAASFHGGNLASDSPDSPHANAASIEARIYVGTAGVDSQLSAGTVGAAGRGAADRRDRPHHRELCRHAAWLGGIGSQRLRRGRGRTALETAD